MVKSARATFSLFTNHQLLAASGGMACRVEAGAAKAQGRLSPPSPRLRRDSLRSPLRRERRLEAGITLPLVIRKCAAELNSKMFFDERPARSRFEIALERCSPNSIRKRDICLQTPWSPFRGVKNSSCIMISQSFTQVVRQACIESVLVTLAVQNVDVEELCHVLSLACRVVARSVAVARLNMSAFAKATA